MQAELCRKHCTSQNTYYTWKRKYGDLETKDVQRLKEQERENAQLKRLLAERDLEVNAAKQLLRKNGQCERVLRSSEVAGAHWLMQLGLSMRCACHLVRAALLPEFGTLNHKRVYRLWKQAKLTRPTKRKKKRTENTVPLSVKQTNQVWCLDLDFCHNACLNGTRLKVLAVKDEFTRECLALEAATNLTSQSVQRILARLFEERGAPSYLRSDNGPEFICRTLRIWLVSQGSHSCFIKPDSPSHRVPFGRRHAESFIARLRAECLNAEVFYNLADSLFKLGIYQRYCKHERPHCALNYLPPAAFAT